MSKKIVFAILGIIIICLLAFVISIFVDLSTDSKFIEYQNKYDEIYVKATDFSQKYCTDGVYLDDVLVSINRKQLESDLSELKQNIEQMQKCSNTDKELSMLRKDKIHYDYVSFIYNVMTGEDELTRDERGQVSNYFSLIYVHRNKLIKGLK